MKIKIFNKLSEKFNCKALQKKGFTLAELMIVLAVLAVIAAVLMPTVFNSMPDENKLKFKKGYYTLKRTIDQMVNSDAYDSTEGNFGPKEGYYIGSHPYATTNDNDGSKKFCIEFANTLNNVEEQCTNFANTLQTGITIQNFDDATSAATSTAIDAKCAASSLTTAVNVKTQDDVYWWLPLDNFAEQVSDGASPSSNGKAATIDGYSNIPAYYAVVCMDVDGPNGAEAPFGFGIRRDGKVIAGAHAKEWLQEGTTNVLPDAD